MQCAALQNTAQVKLRGCLLVRVHEIQQRLAHQRLSLVLQMMREHGVEVQEVQVGREQAPVCE